jgi:hypothetical protein
LRRSLAFLLLLWCSTAAAEPFKGNAAEVATQVAARRAANEELLARQSWKERTELQRRGKIVASVLEAVHVAPDGTLERAPLDDPSLPKDVRQRIARSKSERAQLATLSALLAEYALPTTERIRDFLTHADMSPGDIAGTIRIRGQGVVHEGDELTLWVEGVERDLVRTKVLTRIDATPVIVEIDHARLESGLVYRSRQVVRVPSHRVLLTVEAFDFTGG